MLDLVDRFWMKLLNDFGEYLENDLKRFGKRLAEATEEEDRTNTDLYISMISQTRDILDDLSDENFDIKTFVSLLYEKYPPPKGEEET